VLIGKLPVEVKTAGQPFYVAAIAEFSALSWSPMLDRTSSLMGRGLGWMRLRLVYQPCTRQRKRFAIAKKKKQGLACVTTTHAAVVQAQFEKQAKLGAMIKITVADAEKEWGPSQLLLWGP